MMDDTIAAISTPIGMGGIAMIRVSGPFALPIADSIFVSATGLPSSFSTHTIHFGTIKLGDDPVDQVMLTVMRGPKSYTGEDTVEINCHGGILTAQRILRLCLSKGARLAEPGEFTKRAFLNGRMDLAQAESVADLIHAHTEMAQTVAARTLEGRLSAKVNRIRDRLTTVLAHIEAHIDFPEEDIGPEARDKLLGDLRLILVEIGQLIATARDGKILREGVPVAIIGRPNAGKSSVMNALLGHERSIVTPYAGTTRDTIEEYANIGGVPVRFTDTAGIRKPRGTIEKIGVERSHKALDACVLALHIIDSSRRFHQDDDGLRKLSMNKPTIMVLNKTDLPRRFRLPKDWDNLEMIEMSAKTGCGLTELKQCMLRHIWSGKGDQLEVDVAINERHAQALAMAKNILTQSVDDFSSGASLEIVAQTLRSGLDQVGEIVGKTTTEDILAKIFSTFCIGK